MGGIVDPAAAEVELVPTKDTQSHFDRAKAEAFAGRALTALNNGALCLMVSIGHRVGLFDTADFDSNNPSAALPLYSTVGAIPYQPEWSISSFDGSGLRPGTFYVGAFMDVNSNWTPDPGEPWGLYESNGRPAPVTVADGKLIVLSEKGELLVAPATPDGFNPTARAQVLGGKCWTVPVLANGHIYARNAVGDVVCLDVSGN